MKSFSSIAKIGFFLMFLAALSFVFGACGLKGCIQIGTPAITVIVHNQTSETLQIFLDDEVFVGEAIPGGELKFRTHGVSADYIITAKDVDGNRVYETGFTYDALKSERSYDVYFPPKETETESSDNVTGK